MSRRVKLPHCRKFPPRISQEDLKAQITEILKENGTNYHAQAQLYEAASHQVVGSKAPVFCTLQPQVHQHREKAWIIAYEFVYAYLAKYGMDLTKSAMKVEFGASGEPKLTRRFQRTDLDRFYAQLTPNSGQAKTLPFQMRVARTAKAKGWLPRR
jgi:hypothetical protein